MFRQNHVGVIFGVIISVSVSVSVSVRKLPPRSTVHDGTPAGGGNAISGVSPSKSSINASRSGVQTLAPSRGRAVRGPWTAASRPPPRASTRQRHPTTAQSTALAPVPRFLENHLPRKSAPRHVPTCCWNKENTGANARLGSAVEHRVEAKGDDAQGPLAPRPEPQKPTPRRRAAAFTSWFLSQTHPSRLPSLSRPCLASPIPPPPPSPVLDMVERRRRR